MISSFYSENLGEFFGFEWLNFGGFVGCVSIYSATSIFGARLSS